MGHHDTIGRLKDSVKNKRGRFVTACPPHRLAISSRHIVSRYFSRGSGAIRGMRRFPFSTQLHEGKCVMWERIKAAPVITGAVFAIIGIILAVGGAQLVQLGYPRYYLLAGTRLIASGLLFALGRRDGRAGERRVGEGGSDVCAAELRDISRGAAERSAGCDVFPFRHNCTRGSASCGNGSRRRR